MKKLILTFILSAIGLSAQTSVPDATVGKNTSVTLTVTVGSGTPPFQYAWFKNNNMISGSVTDTLVLSPLAPEQSGLYSCRVTNSAGVTNAPQVQVTIAAAPPPPPPPTVAPGAALISKSVN